MIFDASKIYLSILQKTLLTNDILITVMNLIEILPITLHIINSSFYLSTTSHRMNIQNISSTVRIMICFKSSLRRDILYTYL